MQYQAAGMFTGIYAARAVRTAVLVGQRHRPRRRATQKKLNQKDLHAERKSGRFVRRDDVVPQRCSAAML